MSTVSPLSMEADRILTVSRRHGAVFVALFGSAVRGDDGPASDIDVLVRFSEPKSLLDLDDIQTEMTKEVGRRIDLVTERSLNPAIRESVQRDMAVILDEPA